MSRYHRYLRGDCEQVWREFVAIPTLREGTVEFGEACDVAKTFVDRAFWNLETLKTRLTELGYEFFAPERAFVPAKSARDSAESTIGLLPMVMRVWYSKIESVDFRQADVQRWCASGDEHTGDLDVFGLGCNPRVIVQSVESCLLHAEELRKDRDGFSDPNKYENFIPLGPYASNCEPKGFKTPVESLDATFFNDGGGDISFGDDLREAFRWGAFPLWRLQIKNPDFYFPGQFVPRFDRVLPVLRDGLLEL